MSAAKLWPATLPRSIREDRYRQAEVRVYDSLRDTLSAGWTVFYSRPWLGVTPTGGERDGECDFLLVHPDRGMLAIEVKGGDISYDPASDSWTSRDRDRIRHTIKNPIDQARSAKHELFRRLKDMPGWPKHAFVRLRHGVIFPDVARPLSNLGPDRPRELFACRPDLERLGDWVEQRVSGGEGQEVGPGQAGVEACRRLLAAPFELRVPLGHRVADDEAAIATLTPTQFHVLDAISELKRVAVGGGAGTGKTIVAVEDAARLAGDGCRVLLTCRSEPLALALQARLTERVTVKSSTSLCQYLARESGLTPPDGSVDDSGPDVLARAVEARPDLRFDAIVVDEAQDFRTHWWLAFEALLRDPSQSQLHAFYDTNQSVYGELRGRLAEIELLPIRLTRNLRNTQAIHGASMRFYTGLPVTADGPVGEPVAWIGSTAIAADTVSRIRRLVEQEGVPAADAVVLASSPELRDLIAAQLSKLTDQGLTVSNVTTFKGLERPVVVMAVDRELIERTEQAYVGLSRARTHLSVIGPAPVIEWLRGV